MPNYIGRMIFQNKLVSTLAKAPLYLYLPDTYQYGSDKTRSPQPP